MKKVFGINPVKELLLADKDIEIIYLQSDTKNKFKEIISLAKGKKVRLDYTDKDFFNQNFHGENHQGVCAYLASLQNPDLSESELYSVNKDKILFLMLDGITDPHNLGAVIRSADVFGVDCVILPKDKSAKINETVYKTSSGAVSYVPTCTVTNLSRTLEKLKENEFWVYGAEKDGGINPEDENFPAKCVLVIGSEGKGMRRLVKENCDIFLTIPSLGNVDSLNASNACAVLLYAMRNKINKI